jgi:hypothetical protein
MLYFTQREQKKSELGREKMIYSCAWNISEKKRFNNVGLIKEKNNYIGNS